MTAPDWRDIAITLITVNEHSRLMFANEII